MKPADPLRVLALLLAICVIGGCGSGGVTSEPVPPTSAPPTAERETYPDPHEAVAGKITEAVGDWVAERANEDGIYNIPPRGGKDVAGTIGDFHTVHQNDADTYTVCVDFIDGDNTYDVDFFIDRRIEGLTVRDAYLHKINGEVVSG